MNKPASIHHNFEFLNTEVEKWLILNIFPNFTSFKKLQHQTIQYLNTTSQSIFN